MKRLMGAMMASVAFMFIAGVAGDPPQSEPIGGTPPPDLLAGPVVDSKDEATDPDSDRMRRRVSINLEQWREMVEGLALSDSQREAARAILLERRRLRQEYQREHGERIRELREKFRASRAESSAGDLRLAAELREIESGMPNAEQAIEQLWNILTIPQQLELQQKVRAFRAAAMAASRTQTMDGESGIRADDGSEDTMSMAGSSMTAASASENSISVLRGQMDKAARTRLAFLRRHQLARPHE